MNDGHVKYSIEDGVATIEFFHPAQNALPGYLLRDLCEAIDDADRSDEVTLVLIKSAGERTFCAGASFNELITIDTLETGKQFFMGFANVINAIRTCKKIVICRVQGKAVGGGVGIAAACDYTMSSKYASVRLSELAVGIGPFVIGPVVERKVGFSAFSQMALNADEWQTAEWAKQKGLYTECFDTTEQLDAYITHFIKALRSKSVPALLQLKKVFWEGTDHWNSLLESRAEMSGKLILSPEAKQAIQSFLKA
ncbi:MAG: enoyl-CoA hydratase/isomerase family protein [Saprospiraceae bacterium]